MSGVLQILVSRPVHGLALALVAAALLAGCGQKGALYLPSGEAAIGRVTLPESLKPAPSTAVAPAPAASSPTTGIAAPVRNP